MVTRHGYKTWLQDMVTRYKICRKKSASILLSKHVTPDNTQCYFKTHVTPDNTHCYFKTHVTPDNTQCYFKTHVTPDNILITYQYLLLTF